ncbi:AMP-binding protein [Paenibacillus sp. EKM208P]|nr:AMP-binding protein [Paenibacillus sp. EKM208P]
MDFYNDISQYNDSVAFITEQGEQVTYHSFLNEADEIVKRIDGRCLVFCVCQNSLEAVTGYISFLRRGIVPVLISDSQKPDLFNKLLQQYKPKYMWMPKKVSEFIDNTTEVYASGSYVLLKTSYYIDYVLNDELALLLTTSGSTGSPKLVRLSYKNITSNANSIAQYLEISSKDRPITTLPMYYTYGLSILNSHLLKGASIVLTGKTLMDKLFWELVREYKVTTFGGVPYTYEILKKLRFERMELPSLRVLTQAGGKLGIDVSGVFANICRTKGIAFIVMYGQTEATARMSYLPKDYAVDKAGSIGIPIPGGQFHLEDNSNGEKISENDMTGELVFQGDNVSMGYAENSYDLQKGDENKGILKTGDLARRDSDGFYYIVGRKNRFIKIFGNRVNLDEVESILKSEGYECACTGEDNLLRIYVTKDKNEEKIRKIILSKSDLNPAGFKILFTDALPYNEAGKIIYSKLK